MATIKISVSDDYNTFDYIFNLEDNTSIGVLKTNLARTLNCGSKHIELSHDSRVLDDIQTLNMFTPATSDSSEPLLRIKIKAITPSIQASAAASPTQFSELEGESLTPALVMWLNFAQKRTKAPIPLTEIQTYKENVDLLGREIDPRTNLYHPSHIFNPDFPKPVGIEISRSKGIPTALHINDFEQSVGSLLDCPGAPTRVRAPIHTASPPAPALTAPAQTATLETEQSDPVAPTATAAATEETNPTPLVVGNRGAFDIKKFKIAWGLMNKLTLSFDEFSYLMELHSRPISHSIFDASVRAAFIEANELFKGNEDENPKKRMQHVIKAVTRMAEDIFAHAVNSSMGAGSGILGAWSGFLPKTPTVNCLQADGRIGAYTLGLSWSNCKITISYNIADTGVVHEIIKLNNSGTEYKLRGITYPSLSALIQNNKALFKHPCLISSLITQKEGLSIKAAQLLAPQKKLSSWVICDILMHAFFGATFHNENLIQIKTASQEVHLTKTSYSDTTYLSSYPAKVQEYLSSLGDSLPKMSHYGFTGFHGYMNYEEACELLHAKPQGSYLLRASLTQIGSIILVLVDADGKIIQSMISPDPSSPSGVVCSDNTFASLEKLIQKYSTPASDGTPPLLKVAIEPQPCASLMAEVIESDELMSPEPEPISRQTSTTAPPKVVDIYKLLIKHRESRLITPSAASPERPPAGVGAEIISAVSPSADAGTPALSATPSSNPQGFFAQGASAPTPIQSATIVSKSNLDAIRAAMQQVEKLSLAIESYRKMAADISATHSSSAVNAINNHIAELNNKIFNALKELGTLCAGATEISEASTAAAVAAPTLP